MSAAEKITTEVRLYELIKGLVELSDFDYSVMDKLITGIQIDSRFVRKSDLFIACFGRNHDARNYIDLAIESGCAAVLAEFTVGMRRLDVRSNVPVIGIDNLSGGYKAFVPKGENFTFIKLNLERRKKVAELFQEHKPDVLFHFAAYAAEGLSPFIRNYNYRNNVISVSYTHLTLPTKRIV